jgi:xylulokinase
MTPVSDTLTVGIDIGTTSVKAIAADADGNVVARARVPHRLRIPQPDQMEHDAAQAWRRGPAAALRKLGLSELAAPTSAVTVSCMVPSLTAVDRRGRPTTPGLLYGDGRGRVPGQRRDGAGDGGEVLEFLRWTVRRAPDAAGYWSAQAVANKALAGVGAIDGSTAFTTFPLYGLEGWDEKLLAEAGARVDQMPAVEGNGAPIGTVKVSGVPPITLGAGAIDAMGEQIVSAADSNDGDVLAILGTTLIVWAVIGEDRQVPGLWTIPSFAPGKLLIGGPSNAGGLFLNWACGLFGRPRSSDGRPHPDRVPVWSPYVRGERVPLHDPDRRAVLDGLDLLSDAAACRRAAYEASGFATRHLLDLGGALAGARRIVATGGGVRVPEWTQALADCTGLPVDVVAVPEGGALGAAWFARMAAGLETSMTDAARWARTSHRVEPDREWVDACTARYERYRALADG